MVTVISKNSLEYYDFRMLRKQIRERREYIYRKHKEEAESKIRDRKDRLKRALDENKPIPTELRVRQSFKSSPGNEIRNWSLFVGKLPKVSDRNRIYDYFQEDALKLQEALEYDDEGATHFSSVDDEYKYGGVEDPKVNS